jgi:hypothetical protein
MNEKQVRLPGQIILFPSSAIPHAVACKQFLNFCASDTLRSEAYLMLRQPTLRSVSDLEGEK